MQPSFVTVTAVQVIVAFLRTGRVSFDTNVRIYGLGLGRSTEGPTVTDSASASVPVTSVGSGLQWALIGRLQR
jgi:hypothetical protein